MLVLVTGARGFIGRAVVAALSADGHEVLSLTRAESSAPGTRRADVRDAPAIAAAVADVDAVCHLAGRTQVRESFADPLTYWKTNAGGTLNLLSGLVAAAERSGPKRLVIASTAAVYGTPKTQPIREDAPTLPLNPYGASKLAADQAAASVAATGALGAVSLRAFNVAGAAAGTADPDRTRLIPKILAVQAGLEPELAVNGDGSAVRDFVHATDMAAAFVRALNACTPGEWRTYNVGSGRRTSIADVVRTAEELRGRALPKRYAPPANEPPVLQADPTRIQRELGWQPKNSDLATILEDGWSALTSGYSGKE